MKDCEKYLELISASLDGEISAEERAALEAHLAECPDCRRVAEAFSAIGSETAAKEEVPFDFCERTMYKIKLESERPRGIQKFIKGYGRYTGLAAALVILLIGASTVPNIFNAKNDTSGMNSAPNPEYNDDGQFVSGAAPEAASGEGSGIIENEDLAEPDAPLSAPTENEDSSLYSDTEQRSKQESASNDALSDNSAPLMLGIAPPSAEEFYSEHGYGESFYCIAHLIADVPPELEGCEVIHFDNEGEHYKVPQATFTKLEAEGLFDTIIFDDLSSDTAIVIADSAEEAE